MKVISGLSHIHNLSLALGFFDGVHLGHAVVIKNAVKYVDENNPVILRISYAGGNGHWIVVVGYSTDENDNVAALLTLDPGNDSPTYSMWNGMLSLQKDGRKKYGYRYTSDKLYMVDFDAEVIITCI